jgi:pimeloyl-ACP methyl ester carboxylesterase
MLRCKNQLVVGFKTLNPFPVVGKSHDKMAEDVVAIIKEVCTLNGYASLAESKYNIVGHSLGGKVALMVAARYDKNKVDVVIALDPVDANPPGTDLPEKLSSH